LGRDGILVANNQDEKVTKLAKQVRCKVAFYRDFYRDLVPLKGTLKGTKSLKLRISGKHNISNAMAALAVAKILKIPQQKAIGALNEFSGTWRRMEYRGAINGAKIYDDYGHHPTEIKATLAGARELLDKIPNSQFPVPILYCVFQPHQYQRTYKLFKHFLNAFDSADKTIILPIFSVPGREKESIKKKVNSKMLVKAIKKYQVSSIKYNGIVYIDSFGKAKNYLKENLKRGDICIIMGAGDVYRLTELLVDRHD
jgi:UDP-N-acetylmuramate--alanine ligase